MQREEAAQVHLGRDSQVGGFGLDSVVGYYSGSDLDWRPDLADAGLSSCSLSLYSPS